MANWRDLLKWKPPRWFMVIRGRIPHRDTVGGDNSRDANYDFPSVCSALGIALAALSACANLLGQRDLPFTSIYTLAFVVGAFEGGSLFVFIWASICSALVVVSALCGIAADGGWPGIVALLTIVVVAVAFIRSHVHRRDSRRRIAEVVSDRQALADSLPQVLWGTGPDGRCDFLNARYTEQFGLQREPAIKNQTWADPIHPADRPKMYEIWRRAIDTGSSEFSAYARVRMRDGSYRWVLSSGRSVRSKETGEVVRWFGGLLDVDDEVRSLETISRLVSELENVVDENGARLADADARIRSIFSDRSIGMIEQEFSGLREVLTQVSAGPGMDLQGYLERHPRTAGELAKRVQTTFANDTLLAVLGFENLDAFLEAHANSEPYVDRRILGVLLKALLSGAEAASGTATLLSADGKARRFGLTLNLMPEDRARLLFLDVDAHPKTAMRTRLELERAGRVAAAAALSASVVHEISQPITAMTLDLATAAKLATSDPPRIPALQKIIERLRWNAGRLAEIGSSTRARIRSRWRVQEPLDLCLLANHARDLLEESIDTRLAVVQVVVNDNPPMIFGDRVELQQVFVNLLANALDAVALAPEGKRKIEVTFDVKNGGASISAAIADTGPGMPDGQTALLFQPFFSTKPNRLGLGLTICQATIEAMGGEITARNRHGGGAVFEFVLPIAAPTS